MAGHFGMCGGNEGVEGKRFGLLVAASVHQVTMPSGRKRAEWLCQCECGGTRMVSKDRLVRGITTHCGCRHSRNVAGVSHARHSPEYRTWVHIRQRCYNSKHLDFEYYGGRGIKVHPRWHVFANFLADMGRRPTGLTIDRIDLNGDYSPTNCRWATMTVQNNNSRNCRWITFAGETLTLTQWADRLGLEVSSLSGRLKTWTLEEALTRPSQKRK